MRTLEVISAELRGLGGVLTALDLLVAPNRGVSIDGCNISATSLHDAFYSVGATLDRISEELDEIERAGRSGNGGAKA